MKLELLVVSSVCAHGPVSPRISNCITRYVRKVRELKTWHQAMSRNEPPAICGAGFRQAYNVAAAKAEELRMEIEILLEMIEPCVNRDQRDVLFCACVNAKPATSVAA